MNRILRDSQWDRNHVISGLLKDVRLPPMVRIRQNFERSCVEDLSKAIRDAVSQEKIRNSVRPGMRIAITAGSRGTDRYPEEMRAIVSALKELGAEPFIIPAMGSHGGGTAEGQMLVLRALGITEETVGAPIYATMEVVRIGTNIDGQPVYIDKYAAEADGIVIVNRIKPYTHFRGEYESGLMKMMTIRLGKNVGAAVCHRFPTNDIPHNLFAFGSAVLQCANILFGIATLENPLDEVRKVVALTPEEIPEREKLLLADAKMSAPTVTRGRY